MHRTAGRQECIRGMLRCLSDHQRNHCWPSHMVAEEGQASIVFTSISPTRKTTALMMACGEIRTLSEEPKDHEIGPGIDRPLDQQTSDRNTKKLSKSRMTPVSAMPSSYRSVDSL